MATKIVCDMCGAEGATSHERLWVSNRNMPETVNSRQQHVLRNTYVDVSLVKASARGDKDPQDLCRNCWGIFLTAAAKMFANSITVAEEAQEKSRA